MSYTLAADSGLVDWANTVIAVVGIMLAIVAIVQTRRSNAAAKQANDISRDANGLATQANDYAKKAVQMQEEEGKVRLVVKPRMWCMVGDGEDERPRPMVEVINLSAFPVTVTAIWWKTNRDEKAWFFWKNPQVTAPYASMPLRLPSHEAFTAIGKPDSFKSIEDLAAITAAVAFTACDERIEGMTEDWKTQVAKMVEEHNAGKQKA